MQFIPPSTVNRPHKITQQNRKQSTIFCFLLSVLYKKDENVFFSLATAPVLLTPAPHRDDRLYPYKRRWCMKIADQKFSTNYVNTIMIYHLLGVSFGIRELLLEHPNAFDIEGEGPILFCHRYEYCYKASSLTYKHHLLHRNMSSLALTIIINETIN